MPQDNGTRKVYAIAIDPGGTTGLAMAPFETEPWKVLVQEMTGEHHMDLIHLLYDNRPEFLICETFHNVGNEAARLHSSEIIGCVKAYSQATHTPVVWQSPATGKQFWTDEKLKQCGLYVVGLQHARDAVRHYAYWRLFTLNDRAILQRDQGTPGGWVRRSRPS
jgi:hypothetical protein